MTRPPRLAPSAAALRPADWGRLVLLSLLWGASFFFVAVAVPYLPPLTIVWLRVALAALALGTFIVMRGLPLPALRDWPTLAIMGVLNNALPFTLLTAAQGAIPGGLAAILNATTPLFTLVVVALAGVERLTLPRLAGLCLGIAGVAVLTGGAGRAPLVPLVLCLAAALSYALAKLWGRRIGARGIAPATAALGMLASTAVILLPLLLAIDRPWTLAPPPLAVSGAIVALAVMSTAAAYLLYFRLLADAGAVNLSLVTFLIPVSAVALGTLLLAEPLLARHLAGLALILCGLALAGGMLRRRG